MEPILLVLHVLLALALIGLVLIQHGKGAEVGASFGSGASSTVFGARGSASFLTKLTTIIAVIFFATSLSLAYISATPKQDISLIDNIAASKAAEEKASAEQTVELTPKLVTDPAIIEELSKGEATMSADSKRTDASDSTQPVDVPAIDEE